MKEKKKFTWGSLLRLIIVLLPLAVGIILICLFGEEELYTDIGIRVASAWMALSIVCWDGAEVFDFIRRGLSKRSNQRKIFGILFLLVLAAASAFKIWTTFHRLSVGKQMTEARQAARKALALEQDNYWELQDYFLEMNDRFFHAKLADSFANFFYAIILGCMPKILKKSTDPQAEEASEDSTQETVPPSEADAF